jgi:SAM-dependent methyltransferase
MSKIREEERFYQRKRIAHWNNVAQNKGGYSWFRKAYHKLLERHYQLIVPVGMRILELGCGEGDLLEALEPSLGVGLDFSHTMLEIAKKRHPKHQFIQADAHIPALNTKFDYIILSDLVNDLWDVQKVIDNLSQLTHPRTRIIFNFFSRLWQLPLSIADLTGMKRPSLEQNWLTVQDLENLLKLSEVESIKTERAILFPGSILGLSKLVNRVLVKLWPLNLMALTNIIIARPVFSTPVQMLETLPSVSVIIPARNEEGNIEDIFARTPELGDQTELIFVEGHSEDATFDKITKEIKRHSNRSANLLKQKGVGKADAVKEGFAAASGDVLMILDADLSVPPEDLSRFYEALVSGKAEFVNGVRLVYPMEDRAMRSLNFLGNKFFSLTFSWLLGQTIKDTLCGTKVIRRSDYQLLTKHWSELGVADPFGDFDLLFGAAKLCLKIVDMPIRYRERKYGSTNIHRWRHGLMLLRMVVRAAYRLKFV